MTHRLNAAFSQLATQIEVSAVMRRALFEDIAKEFGEWHADWEEPTGTEIRTTFNSDESTTVSNPPTQAEVQAINDRLVETRQLLKAVISLFSD